MCIRLATVTTMLSSYLKAFLFFVATLIIVAHADRIKAGMFESTIILPGTIDSWTLSETVRHINADNIFEYMNGAGELYLGYGFDHLDVWEYGSGQDNTILVEIYFMNTSDDAFGLLSLDWSGEPVLIDKTQHKGAFPSRALYGGGLLRLWADTVYARVLTFRETESSKAAVISIGRHISKDRELTPEPALMHGFPESVPGNWKLRRDRMGYFRSHLVLNSLYYLSHQNIFDLGPTVEAVTAPFERTPGQGDKVRIQALMINYATARQALGGLERFHDAYLDDFHNENLSKENRGQMQYFRIEDGWLAYVLNDTCLTVVFECPDQSIASHLLRGINCSAR